LSRRNATRKRKMLTLGDAADDDDVTRRAEELEVDIARKTNKSSERDPLLVIGNQ